MLSRALGSVLVLLAASAARGQDVFVNGLPRTPANGTGGSIESAWVDLRQTSAANSKPQSAPDWVESVTLVPGEATAGVDAAQPLHQGVKLLPASRLPGELQQPLPKRGIESLALRAGDKVRLLDQVLVCAERGIFHRIYRISVYTEFV